MIISRNTNLHSKTSAHPKMAIQMIIIKYDINLIHCLCLNSKQKQFG